MTLAETRYRMHGYRGWEKEQGIFVVGCEEDNDSILEGIVSLQGVDCAALFVRDEGNGGFEMVAHYGLSSHFVEAYRRFDRDSDFALKNHGGSIWARDFVSLMQEFGNDRVLMEGIRAILTVPVLEAGCVIGSIHVASRTHSAIPPQTVSAVEQYAARFVSAVRLLRPE